ncbi:MAG: hydroxysqualene dehydroxylase HpnE [Planctomycetes bacterium]|nr:hydroxysqualene dehydroxylase HpnE [Planctomycetota bacterium]
MKRAVVLGGGVAGIAAAFALRDRGVDVELIESRGWLGGRAFTVPQRGELDAPIDNGPHVILGCYDHFRRLLRRIGSDDRFERTPALRLAFVDRDGERSVLGLSRFPAPLALPWAILRFGGVPLGARLRLLWAMSTIPLARGAGRSLEDWIAARGQRDRPRAFVWDPLCRAIMNADPKDVSASLFLATLRRAFLGSASRAAIHVPARPWSQIVGEPALAQLGREGVKVRLGARVTEMVVEARRTVAVEVGGETLRIDEDVALFSAMPWHALQKLTGERVRLVGSPIVSVYFELESDVGLPDDPVVALVDGDPFHFVCRAPDAPPGTFAVLSGGCREFDGMRTDAIEASARRQLQPYFPRADLERGRARVVKESRATFVGAPGSEVFRPKPGRHPDIENLWLCGDWTDVGLPSTLEGAAESAARAVADFGC